MHRCPNCRERLSSVEDGLGGILSCLYCEGTWLEEAQVARLPGGCFEESDLPAAQTLGDKPALVCAVGHDGPLQEIHCGELAGWRCAECHGAFFSKGLVQRLAPDLASTSAEAPVPAAMLAAMGTVALLGEPLLWISALRKRRQP